MGHSKFVKTADEIERIRERLTAARFVIDSLDVEFETTTEFVRSVLPPCLEPADRATGLISISKQETEICGTFNGVAVLVSARNQDVEGLYSVSLIYDAEIPVSLGREMWGEPKKFGTADLLEDGRFMYGWADRKGTRLIEVEAELGDDTGPQETSFTSLEVKAQIDSYGRDLLYDPILLGLDVKVSATRVRTGPADVTIRGSQWDPLDSIPILSTGDAVHSVGECHVVSRSEWPQSDRAAYAPYILGRYYDDLSLFRVPQRHRALSAAGANR